jgi:hypothetical protein
LPPWSPWSPWSSGAVVVVVGAAVVVVVGAGAVVVLPGRVVVVVGAAVVVVPPWSWSPWCSCAALVPTPQVGSDTATTTARKAPSLVVRLIRSPPRQDRK